MFGEPCPAPRGALVLPLLWTYMVKTEGIYKARCCCNGSPSRYGSSSIAHTYAAALEQPGSRLFWGLAAIKNLLVYGSDASNAFAEAPPPIDPFYVAVDTQFREWWKAQGKPDIPRGYVLPVKHALQGHPESPRLWATKIHGILKTLGFKATTHEPCLYIGTINGEKCYFLRQVDDFAVAAPSEDTALSIIRKIGAYLKKPLKELGLLERFNGIDIVQSRHYNKIHCGTYINKIVAAHGWENTALTREVHTPMRSDSAYQTSLETAVRPLTSDKAHEIASNMGFSYRQAIGELIFAAVTCRIDILYAVIKLSQYSSSPAAVHFTAVKNIFRYLRTHPDKGLHFWRTQPNYDLPNMPFPDIRPDNYVLTPNHHDAGTLYGYVDSDWAGDKSHRRSISGAGIMFAGACIAYFSKHQVTIALSSTEAEFVAACDAAKTCLYIRTMLEELDLEQENATIIYEDNNGALLMANAQRPTRRTRHLDIRHFSLLDWVQSDLILLHAISTHDNASDALTKALAPILFWRHNATLMGMRPPSYVTSDV